MILNKEYILGLTKQKGWNQSQLAIKVGVSKQTISFWLNNQRGAGPNLIAGIRKAFPEENLSDLFVI